MTLPTSQGVLRIAEDVHVKDMHGALPQMIQQEVGLICLPGNYQV